MEEIFAFKGRTSLWFGGLFCLLPYPDEQPTYRSRTFGRVSFSLAELSARDLLCSRREDDFVTVTAGQIVLEV